MAARGPRASAVGALIAVAIGGAALLSAGTASASTMVEADALDTGALPSNVYAGASVAISSDGSTTAVGAPDPLHSTAVGSVLVYQRSAGAWGGARIAATLTPSNPASGQRFGNAVAVSGDGSVIAVGAPGTGCAAGSDCGAVYVFDRPAGGWSGTLTETAEIPAATAGGAMGYAVALSPDASLLAAGAPEAGGAAGAVHMYGGAGSSWSEELGSPISPSLGGAGAFGESLAIIDDKDVVAGAPFSTIGSYGDEGALILLHQGTRTLGMNQNPFPDWNTQATLYVDADPASSQLLGWSVAASAGIIVGGAPTTSDAEPGSAYVFAAPAGGWSAVTNGAGIGEQAKLTVPTGSGGSDGTLGDSVAVTADGATIYAGAAGSGYLTEGSGPLPDIESGGGLFRFSEPAAGWAAALVPTDPLNAPGNANGGLGWSLALDGDGGTLVAGAPEQSVGANYPGQADVFQLGSNTSLTCAPASVTVGQSAQCVVTVVDPGGDSPSGLTPSGSVTLSSSGAGAFAGGATCALAPTANAGIASCVLAYTPSAVGSGTHTITASYAGGADFLGGGASATVPVTAAPPSSGTSGAGSGGNSAAASPKPELAIVGSPSIHGKRLWLRLRCPGASATCVGTVTLRLGKRRLAGGSFTIGRGATRVLKLRFDARLLGGRRGRVAVSATLVGHYQPPSASFTKKLKLPVPRRR